MSQQPRMRMGSSQKSSRSCSRLREGGSRRDVNISRSYLAVCLTDCLSVAWIYGDYADEASAEEDQAPEIPLEDAPKEEVVVAVMGVTGSGKSTFIKTMTKNAGVHVGHGLESGTSTPFFVLRKAYSLPNSMQTHQKSAHTDSPTKTLPSYLSTPPASTTQPAATKKS